MSIVLSAIIRLFCKMINNLKNLQIVPIILMHYLQKLIKTNNYKL